MAIEIQVDSLDQVEESMRGVYVEEGGKFRLDVDKYADFKAQGLKAKNGDLLKKLNDLKPVVAKGEKFKEVEDDEWEAYLQFKEKQANGGDPNKPDPNAQAVRDAVATAVKREQEKFGKTEKELKDQIAELTNQNRDFAIWTPVQKAAAESKVLPDRLAALVTILKANKRFDMDEQGKLVFNDPEGYPTGLTLEKAFSGPLKEEFAWAFAATGAGGSGAEPGKKPGQRAQDLSNLSATERLKAHHRQQANT